MTSLQLVSSRKPLEKPSNFELACRLLKDVLRMEPEANYLLTDGRWRPASLDDKMLRANQRLKSIGRPQFANKQSWVVQ